MIGVKMKRRQRDWTSPNLEVKVDISSKKFARYLLNKDGKQFAKASDSTRCPLNQYIAESLNIDNDDIHVWGDSVAINGHAYKGPKWMTRFVNRVDKTFDNKEVTGYDCIPVLEYALKKRIVVDQLHTENMENESE